MILFENVTKEFHPDVFGIADVSFEIQPGEFVLLTGPSGSGKTTIMKLLTREYTPSEGMIFYKGDKLNSISNSKIHLHRRKIGVVFQNYLLIPELNVWENITLPLSIIGKKQKEIEERVTDLLQLVSLENRALHFPNELSGGEAQRISIARALATGPEVLFADEPTGNLDASTSLTIAELLKQINSFGTTVIFATHDPVIMKAHEQARHIILDKGQIIKDSAAQKKNKKSEQSSAPVKVEDLNLSEKEAISEPEPDKQENDNSEEIAQKTPEKKPEPMKTESRFSLFSFFSKTQKPRKISLPDYDGDNDVDDTEGEEKIDSANKEAKETMSNGLKNSDKEPKDKVETSIKKDKKSDKHSTKKHKKK